MRPTKETITVIQQTTSYNTNATVFVKQTTTAKTIVTSDTLTQG